MRILMLNYEFPPIGGGAGNATYHISRELVKKGCKVDVMTSIFDGREPVECVNGVMVYRVTSWRKDIFDCGVTGAWSYLLFARFQLDKLLKKNEYDVVHIFFSMPTGILSLMDRRIKGLPYVVSLRGSDVPGYDEYNWKTYYLHKVMKPLNKYILKNASNVVALSKGLKDMALKSYPSLPVDVIYNGVESCLFKPSEDRKSGDTVRLIAVSRLINRKGIQHLLKALSMLEDIDYTLKIVGTGSYETVLKRMTERLGLNGKVEFCGYKSREELPHLYSNSDIFVLPSLTESFGQVFVEAMACGLPIVGTTVGGIPEIVRHDENGILIQAGDVESLKTALIFLINNPDLRRAMSERNRLKVERSFTWDVISGQYLDIYRNVAGSKVSQV